MRARVGFREEDFREARPGVDFARRAAAAVSGSPAAAGFMNSPVQTRKICSPGFSAAAAAAARGHRLEEEWATRSARAWGANDVVPSAC